MERKAIIIKGEELKTLNAMLSEGWEVEHISAFAQGMTTGYNGVITGPYGAYVILKRRKQKQELTEDEIKAILATLATEKVKIIENNIWE